MRTRRYNYYALAQPGVLFNAPEGGDGGAGGAGAEGGDAAAQAAATATAAATEAAQAAATAAAQDVKSLPEWAQKVITDARKDAGDNRVAKTSAETERDASKAIVDAINAALNPGAAADPTKLAEQLTTAAGKQRDAEVRLAVFTAATPAGANPVALLDRNSFHKAIEGLDPAAADFSTKVSAAITAAVAADPTLKAVLAAGKSAVDHGAGGSGEGGTTRPKSIGEALARANAQ